MKKQEKLVDFLNYLELQKRYSSLTIAAYKADIEAFKIFVETTYSVESWTSVTSFMVRDWLASFKMEKYASKSILRKKSSVQSFFKFLRKKGIIDVNPTSLLPKIKTEKRLVHYASEKEMNALFAHVHFPDNYQGQLEHLVLHLLYMTGMRVSELTHLKANDIDYYQKNIKLFGKGNKERLVPLSDNTIVFLKAFEQSKSQLTTPRKISSSQLFLSRQGKPLTRQAVYLICKKYLSTVTNLNKKSPHVLRHTFASHLLHNDAELGAIKELLGHSSLAATQVYTHTDMTKIKQTYKKSHPRTERKS